jgi:hypothetical protein
VKGYVPLPCAVGLSTSALHDAEPARNGSVLVDDDGLAGVRSEARPAGHVRVWDRVTGSSVTNHHERADNSAFGKLPTGAAGPSMNDCPIWLSTAAARQWAALRCCVVVCECVCAMCVPLFGFVLRPSATVLLFSLCSVHRS